MATREVIDRYYDCVNRGDWEQWLTLFSDDVVGDEQLAGHFAGISVLQGATDGLRNGYSRFNMYPQHIVIDGDAAVVVWRCVAANSHGVTIAYPNDPNRLVIGANYFQVQKRQDRLHADDPRQPAIPAVRRPETALIRYGEQHCRFFG